MQKCSSFVECLLYVSVCACVCVGTCVCLERRLRKISLSKDLMCDDSNLMIAETIRVL